MCKTERINVLKGIYTKRLKINVSYKNIILEWTVIVRNYINCEQLHKSIQEPGWCHTSPWRFTSIYWQTRIFLCGKGRPEVACSIRSSLLTCSLRNRSTSRQKVGCVIATGGVEPLCLLLPRWSVQGKSCRTLSLTIQSVEMDGKLKNEMKQYETWLIKID